MRQHALTHKNSDRSSSPHSSNTNSDNEQTSQTERNRDNDINEQSDDDEDQPEHFNEDNFANKLADRSPSTINNLASIDEEKGQRGGGGLQATNDQDEHDDISRSQSNSSKDSQNTFFTCPFITLLLIRTRRHLNFIYSGDVNTDVFDIHGFILTLESKKVKSTITQ